MKSFIAALIVAIAAADSEWQPQPACWTYLDELARWLAPRANVVFNPKNKAQWDAATLAAYQGYLDAINNTDPEDPLDEDARAGAEELLNDIDWVNTSDADIQLDTQNAFPVYSGDFAADCEEPAPDANAADYGLKNSKAVAGVTALKINDGSADLLTVTAVTGWVKHGGGDDAGIGYQIAADITSEGSWDGQGKNSVSFVFGNDSAVTNLEYNEFEIINFSTAAQIIRVTYAKQNVDGTNLPDLTGFAPLTDNKKYTVQWRETQGNWTPGNPFTAEFGSNSNTPGFWEMNRHLSWLASGQTSADPTRVVLALEKETIGAVTTNIKAGGKVHGVIGYKTDYDNTPFTAKSGVVPFLWAEEPVVPDPNNGNTNTGGDGGNENTETKDSATSMAAYGAGILAAISALAF